MRSERVRLARIHGTRMEEVVMGQASRTGCQSWPARKRFHHQDERFNDSNRGVPVRSTWAIGPIPYSTTPLQLPDAFWNGSGGVGTPWKVIPLRVLPIKEGRGVGQTWLLGAERPPPALELTLPSGKAKGSVNGRLGQDQAAKGPAPSRGRRSRPVAEAAPATQKNPRQSWRGTAASDRREEMQVQQDPPVNITEMVSKKCEEMKREMLVEVETIRDQTTGELAGAAMQMRTLQEAMTNQQTKMSKVEEVITTTAASAAADQKKTQDMVERMMRMMKEKEGRKKPDTYVELEDDPS